MNHLEAKTAFTIRPVIEQRPFERRAYASFFATWCESNDSIQPHMSSREEWQKQIKTGVLEKQPDGKQTLFLPTDLQLWEMPTVVEAVNRDTYAKKPERQKEAKDRLATLARTFQNAGTYIAQRLDSISEGQEHAKNLALDFYQYGHSLAQGKKPDSPMGITDIAKQHLTPEETETVDRFLAGDKLYELRRKKAEEKAAADPTKKADLYEEERQKTLAQFFKLADKAFALENNSAGVVLRDGPTQIKPWQNTDPVHHAFLKRIDRAVINLIETPKRELETAIFRRGLENLTHGMKESGWKHKVNRLLEKSGLDVRVKQRNLFDALAIPKLRAELEAIRQTGDLAKISRKERKIANKIHRAVTSLPYTIYGCKPSEMVDKQRVSCIGASMLGGVLMQEAGLNYLVGEEPGHSIIVLTSADEKMYWYDMLYGRYFKKRFKDHHLQGTNDSDSQITVKDIVDFSRNPRTNPEGMRMQIPSFWYSILNNSFKRFPNPDLTIFSPEKGHKEQALSSMGYELENLGHYTEAVEAYRTAIADEPKVTYRYNFLGNTLTDIIHYDEAVNEYRQSIAVDPTDPYLYNGLIKILSYNGRHEEAAEACQHAITLDPKKPYPHYALGEILAKQGRKDEAIAEYQKYIDLVNKKQYKYYIRLAKLEIAKLSRKEVYQREY